MRFPRPRLLFERSFFGSPHNHLAAATVTVGILGLLVVPVAPWVLDLAIGASFLISLLLLTATLQVRRASDLSSFPAMLLGATLLRLAISIASTRMILLEARAGEIIHAVGSVAAGANVVVGLVVFVVLGVVQFIVIAKGGDRVAEVAARFTLDSIPGRQMSVDADLRSGLLSASQAGQRRREMEQETYLYGAMDGAMKFVKGDSIATFLVAAVNLAGGIAVGMLQRGLPFADAARSYTLLTIGDGLVAQIPSLLSAMAAAILITRVCSTDTEEGDGGLASEVASQLRQLPRAMGATALLLLAFGLLPGMPLFPFLPASLALGTLTFAIQKRARVNANARRANMPAMARDGGGYLPRILDDVELGTSAPLRVRINPSALQALAPEALNHRLSNLRRQLTLTTGSPFPGVCLLRDDLLPAHHYVVDIEEVPFESSTLVPGCLLVSAQGTPLPQATDGYRPGYAVSRWLPRDVAATLRADDVVSADGDEALCLHLLEICQLRAAHFFGLQDTRFMLGQLSREFDALVTQFESRVGAIALTRTLRALLADGISIRNLRRILDALLAIPASELNQDVLLRHARVALGEQICRRYRDPDGTRLDAEVIEPSWQQQLETCIQPGTDGEPEFLPSAAMLEWVEALVIDRNGRATPILTSAVLRPHLAQLFGSISATAPVLAFEEVGRGDTELRIERCWLAP